MKQQHRSLLLYKLTKKYRQIKRLDRDSQHRCLAISRLQDLKSKIPLQGVEYFFEDC